MQMLPFDIMFHEKLHHKRTLKCVKVLLHDVKRMNQSRAIYKKEENQ